MNIFKYPHIIFIALLAICPTRANALDPVEALQSQADKMGLSFEKQWLNLGHYKKKKFGRGFESYIDSPNFFLDAKGKNDPNRELHSTLRNIFSPIPNETKSHVRCRYPARVEWILSKLKIDNSELPQITCPEFDEWFSLLDPIGITLIFPTAFMNNPASMFGHTFLRIDSAQVVRTSDLLAYAANYGAETGDDNSFIFALKGLFGGYGGFFSVLPYYKQVEKYSDLENRDIWEYKINLTLKESRFLVKHLWELRKIYIDYYFFDENCSFHLLSLLEVAHPDWQLMEQFYFWALPPDTVRSILREHQSISKITYRPAHRTIIRNKSNLLTDAQRELAIDIALGKIDFKDFDPGTIPDEKKSQILELAFEYLNYKIHRSKARSEAEEKRAFALLKERSNTPQIAIDNIATPSVRPDEGHATFKISSGFGFEDEKVFSSLLLRPVFHELLDPEGGYVRGAQIKFFETELRVVEARGFELERFRPLDIISLSPQDDLFKPFSWKLNLGTERKLVQENKTTPVSGATAGVGISRDFSGSHLVYTMLISSLNYNNFFQDHVNFAPGLEIGTISDLNEFLRLELSANGSRHIIGDDFNEGNLALTMRLTITKDISLTFNAKRTIEFGRYFSNALLSGQFYF